MGEIRHPQRPVPRKYLLSILFLAERMATSDGDVPVMQRRVIDVLAEEADMQDFHNDKTYRLLSDRKACDNLDIDAAKEAALVVITLVLKADGVRRPEELEYFTKVREMLGADPVMVPGEIEAHKALALEYLR
jgi:hypothetical protein